MMRRGYRTRLYNRFPRGLPALDLLLEIVSSVFESNQIRELIPEASEPIQKTQP